MTAIIGFLMLAISLLKTVQAHPELPQPIKDQAIALAMEAIAESNTYIAQQAQPATITPMAEQAQPVGVGASTPAPVSPLNVFILKAEQDGTLEQFGYNFYYAGDKPLASLQVNGVNAQVATSTFSNDCIVISGQKTCGYYIVKFISKETAPFTFTLTAEDGSVYNGGTITPSA